LIVDDEEDTADYLYKGLSAFGHDIDWVKSLDDLAYFAEKKNPDAIFIKLAHAHVVGPEIMSAMKLAQHSKTEKIPVYFYIHHTSVTDMAKYEEVCANAANIRKILQHVTLHDLVIIIKECLL